MLINIFSGNENFGFYDPQCIYLFAQSPNHTSCLFRSAAPHPTPFLPGASPLPAPNSRSRGSQSMPLRGFLNAVTPLWHQSQCWLLHAGSASDTSMVHILGLKNEKEQNPHSVVRAGVLNFPALSPEFSQREAPALLNNKGKTECSKLQF